MFQKKCFLEDHQDKLTFGSVDGFGRSNINAGNLFYSPKGLFDTNRPMELIDEPLAGMYQPFIL